MEEFIAAPTSNVYSFLLAVAVYCIIAGVVAKLGVDWQERTKERKRAKKGKVN